MINQLAETRDGHKTQFKKTSFDYKRFLPFMP